MNASSKSSSLAANWEKRMAKSGKKFAKLTTTKAIYDRIVIIEDQASILVIQWLKGSSRKRNLNTQHCGHETFTVKQETISKSDIKDIRYYKD